MEIDLILSHLQTKTELMQTAEKQVPAATTSIPLQGSEKKVHWFEILLF